MTAVDYIWEHMCMLFLWHDGIPDELQDAFNNAKEMEKQQIMEAYGGVVVDDNGNIMTEEQYYNETYKTQAQ